MVQKPIGSSEREELWTEYAADYEWDEATLAKNMADYGFSWSDAESLLQGQRIFFSRIFAFSRIHLNQACSSTHIIVT